MTHLRDFFLLDPTVHFLNHGSFGATPKPVLETYHNWHRRMEAQPVQFLGVQLGDYFAQARTAVAPYLNAPANDIAFVANATVAVNAVARSLRLGPGDEVLSTNHEYGACDNIWQFLSQKQQFRYINQPIPLPLPPADELVELFWQGVTPQTRVIFMSHISSATACTFPVAAICARARQAGILTIIDGAHGPGQIPLDMAAIGADFYTGNFHKWLCAPKSTAFLYARPECQPLIEPLVISWGWGADRTFTFGSDFLDYFQWQGTMDAAAHFSVPAAIQFQAEHQWTAVRQQCHQLLQQTLARIQQLTGLAPLYNSHDEYAQMAVAALPAVDLALLKQQLLQDYHVELPMHQWHGRHLLRVSIQGYNSVADADALLAGLAALLPT